MLFAAHISSTEHIYSTRSSTAYMLKTNENIRGVRISTTSPTSSAYMESLHPSIHACMHIQLLILSRSSQLQTQLKCKNYLIMYSYTFACNVHMYIYECTVCSPHNRYMYIVSSNCNRMSSVKKNNKTKQNPILSFNKETATCRCPYIYYIYRPFISYNVHYTVRYVNHLIFSQKKINNWSATVPQNIRHIFFWILIAFISVGNL